MTRYIEGSYYNALRKACVLSFVAVCISKTFYIDVFFIWIKRFKFLDIKFLIWKFYNFSYAVTDRAWRSLRDMNTDQCLIFSGESGSGKTEAMKLSLQYLTAITGHAREFHQTKYQILQSNIILESFGNARTRLNDNSSRFVSSNTYFKEVLYFPKCC